MKNENVNANVLERLSDLIEKCAESAENIERKLDAALGGDAR
ncbi:hypothetical protein [Weizmannia agrestimuris]|nr:hypothetical protein [Weizmannia agrestimuris]